MTRPLLILAATTGLLLFTLPAQAQTARPAPKPDGPTDAQTGPVGVKLESAPTRLEAIGLSVFLPVDAKAEMTSFGSNATMGVEFPDGLGVLVIKGQKTTNPDLTSREVIESIVDQLRRANGREDMEGNIIQTTVTVRERQSGLAAAGVEGERVYLNFPAFEGQPALVRGFSVFRVEPRQFVVFDLMCEERVFDTARKLYETTVGTMDLSGLEARSEARAAAIENARSLLDGLSPDQLRELAESYGERWERLYTPSSTGDESDDKEHGYRRIRFKSGFRGEVTGKPESRWRGSDKTPGFIVQLDAMALEPNLRVDTRAVYFVSEDFKEESWTVNMALRQGEVTTESSVTGARSGNSMTVQLKQPGLPLQDTKPLIQGDAYVSQVLAQVMIPLLVKNKQTGDFAYYAYNPGTNTITLRQDTVEQPPATPELWVVRSRPDANTPAAKHLFNGRGEPLRTELHNGRIWEPIALDRLVNLWKRKGLPLK